MLINELLIQKGMSKYRLSQKSGVPQTTIVDICSGKAHIERCSAETLYRISQVLGVSMESLVESALKEKKEVPQRASFQVFKSNVCHIVKAKGDIEFIIETLESNEIRELYKKKWYPEALYLLAMVDYLSRENNVPLCKNYSDLRACKLQTPLYPTGLVLTDAALKTERYKEESRANAIPEFMRHNIVENEVRDVC